MKKILLACLFLFGCNDEKMANDAADNLTYFKDHRTGLCFAGDNQKLANVPCDQVSELIVNPRPPKRD